MIIEAKALVYSVQQKIDRLNSEQIKNLDIVSICSALTEAQKLIVKDRMQKVEINKRFRHELLPLEIKQQQLPISSSGEVTMAALPSDYARDLDIWIKATHPTCGTKEFGATKIQSDDKNRAIRNKYWKSSYTWEQVLVDEAGGSLYFYNGKDFSVTSVWIDYIKRPEEIHCPTLVIGKPYVDWNGKVRTADVGLVLEDIESEVVNLACLILTRNIGDPNDFSLQYNNNINSDNTSKI